MGQAKSKEKASEPKPTALPKQAAKPKSVSEATEQTEQPTSGGQSALMQDYKRWKAKKSQGDAVLKQRAKMFPGDDDDALFEAARKREQEAEKLEQEQAATAAFNAAKAQAAVSKISPALNPTAKAAPVPTPAPKVVVVDPPPKPGEPKVVTNALNSVKFEWGPAKKPSNSGPLSYVVECAVTMTDEGVVSEVPEWKQVYSGSGRECTVGPEVLPHLARCTARVCAKNSGGSGPWALSEPFWRVQPVLKEGFGGYGPGKAYWWSQTLEEIDVYFPIKGDKIKASVVHHEPYPNRVVLKRKDTGEILLEGKLHDAVEPDECFWSLTVERGTQCVELSMRKQAPEFASLGLTAPSQFWPQILEGQPEIDKDDLKSKLPDDVVPPDGKPVRQKRPYGREAERAGWSPYGMDNNADPPMEDLNGMFNQ